MVYVSCNDDEFYFEIESKCLSDYDYLSNDQINYSLDKQQIMLKHYVNELNFEKFLTYVKSAEIDLTFENNFLIKSAVVCHSSEILKYLIKEKNMDITFENNAAIQMACTVRCSENLLILIDAGADIFVNNNQPLKNAVKLNSHEIVTILLDAGVDPSFDSNEIFKHILCSPSWDISGEIVFKTVQLLIKYGVDPLINYHEMLNLAVGNGSSSIVKFYSELGADFGCVSKISLINCLKSNSIESIQTLINNGIDFSFINNYKLDETKFPESKVCKIVKMLDKFDIDTSKLVSILTNDWNPFSIN